MTKDELRRIYKQKRKELSASKTEKLQDLLLINFQQLSLPYLQYIHSYLPVYEQNEVDVFPIIDYLRFVNPGMIVSVPKANFATGQMEHFAFEEDTELAENKYGIMEPVYGKTIEPSVLDLVLVPLLAFDEKGFRVGYGKGFYDRFLAACRKDVVKVGLSFFEAETEISDTDKFDISLNYCVTPQKVYEF